MMSSAVSMCKTPSAVRIAHMYKRDRLAMTRGIPRRSGVKVEIEDVPIEGFVQDTSYFLGIPVSLLM